LPPPKQWQYYNNIKVIVAESSQTAWLGLRLAAPKRLKHLVPSLKGQARYPLPPTSPLYSQEFARKWLAETSTCAPVCPPLRREERESKKERERERERERVQERERERMSEKGREKERVSARAERGTWRAREVVHLLKRALPLESEKEREREQARERERERERARGWPPLKRALPRAGVSGCFIYPVYVSVCVLVCMCGRCVCVNRSMV